MIKAIFISFRDRLMVGRLALNQVIYVRIVVPEHGQSPVIARGKEEKVPKVALNIFETESEGKKVYRAVMQKGENPESASPGKLVYQDREEVDSFKDVNDALRRLKEKAKKWAREQVDENGQPLIPFIHNIDINPYD